MNFAHIHLVLNHIPVIGIGIGILLLIYGVFKANDEVKKSGLLVFILCALVSIPVYLTGEPAEEIVEHQAGVNKEAIEEHEDSAKFAVIAIGVLGAASLISFILFRGLKRVPGWCTAVLLILAVAVSAMMARTANLGGQIQHPEIGASGSVVEAEYEDD